MLCPGQCKVHKSPNREEYHRLRFEEHKSFEALANIAAEKGESISHMAFHRHFTRHNPPRVAPLTVKEETWIDEQRQKRIAMLEEIESNLTTLRDMTERLKTADMSKTRNVHALVKVCTETRLTLEFVTKHKELMLGADKYSEEDLIQKILSALDEVPDEYKANVIAKLKRKSP